ncbi:MAG: hypothetical protein E7457_01385 [Ruminococcaceae bacterium]|nr:hypothetical protein [Oscillospiraceae bacterium]
MKHKKFALHIGLRTLKTAVAVVIAMMIVNSYGTTSSKLIFAMLGAMAAVQPTFKDSLTSCLTQIVGVLFGGLVGILLLAMPIPSLTAAGIGIILVITLYNVLHIRYSPSLPSFIVVLLCTTPGVEPVSYALGRIWDTAIGLGVGMLINTLIFPYDNRNQIASTMESLDSEILRFMEETFDGDDILPETKKLSGKVDAIDRQLKIFANQKLLMRPRRQKQQLANYQAYRKNARQLVTHLQVLSQMDRPGRLNDRNRQRLISHGAVICDPRTLDSVTERDIITNYHVEQILTLRQELLEHLQSQSK